MDVLDEKPCPVCALNGVTSFLKLYQMNLLEAIFLCPQLTCPFPLNDNPVIVKRHYTSMPESDISLNKCSFIETVRKLKLCDRDKIKDEKDLMSFLDSGSFIQEGDDADMLKNFFEPEEMEEILGLIPSDTEDEGDKEDIPESIVNNNLAGDLTTSLNLGLSDFQDNILMMPIPIEFLPEVPQDNASEFSSCELMPAQPQQFIPQPQSFEISIQNDAHRLIITLPGAQDSLSFPSLEEASGYSPCANSKGGVRMRGGRGRGRGRPSRGGKSPRVLPPPSGGGAYNLTTGEGCTTLAAYKGLVGSDYLLELGDQADDDEDGPPRRGRGRGRAPRGYVRKTRGRGRGKRGRPWWGHSKADGEAEKATESKPSTEVGQEVIVKKKRGRPSLRGIAPTAPKEPRVILTPLAESSQGTPPSPQPESVPSSPAKENLADDEIEAEVNRLLAEPGSIVVDPGLLVTDVTDAPIIQVPGTPSLQENAHDVNFEALISTPAYTGDSVADNTTDGQNVETKSESVVRKLRERFRRTETNATAEKKTPDFKKLPAPPQLYPKVLSRKIGRKKDLSVHSLFDLGKYSDQTPEGLKNVLMTNKHLKKDKKMKGNQVLAKNTMAPPPLMLSTKLTDPNPIETSGAFSKFDVDLSKFKIPDYIPTRHGRKPKSALEVDDTASEIAESVNSYNTYSLGKLHSEFDSVSVASSVADPEKKHSLDHVQSEISESLLYPDSTSSMEPKQKTLVLDLPAELSLDAGDYEVIEQDDNWLETFLNNN